MFWRGSVVRMRTLSAILREAGSYECLLALQQHNNTGRTGPYKYYSLPLPVVKEDHSFPPVPIDRHTLTASALLFS